MLFVRFFFILCPWKKVLLFENWDWEIPSQFLQTKDLVPFLIFENLVFFNSDYSSRLRKDVLAVKLDDVVCLLCCNLFFSLSRSPSPLSDKASSYSSNRFVDACAFRPVVGLEWLSALYGDVKRIHCEGRPLMRISLQWDGGNLLYRSKHSFA